MHSSFSQYLLLPKLMTSCFENCVFPKVWDGSESGKVEIPKLVDTSRELRPSLSKGLLAHAVSVAECHPAVLARRVSTGSEVKRTGSAALCFSTERSDQSVTLEPRFPSC